MSVVAERDLGRPRDRQAAEVTGLSRGAAPARPPRVEVPEVRAGRDSRPVGSRERPVRGQERRPVTGCSARSPVCRWPAMAALVVVLSAGIAGFGLLAQAVAGTVSETAPIPERTAVVVVDRGESLWEIAREYAPESATAAVIDRIRRLNELTGSRIDVGMPLVVPVG